MLHVGMAQLSLPLRGFLGENMATVRVAAFDTTRSGTAKSLRGTAITFHLWH
jgi:hypothetical protein